MTVAAAAIRVALLLLALVAAAPAVAADVPFMSGRVVDNAELLPRATRERIGATLAAHESATGNEIAVLTVPTLDGESIEGYATRVFDAWKLGKKGKDNGVLLIVVPQDRRLRIEVGYGLEGTLPDVVASRIIRDVMTPAFKGGDYDRGIERRGGGDRRHAGRSLGGAGTRRAGAVAIRRRAPSTTSSRTCRRGRCASCWARSSSASSGSLPSSG